jgi:hypothetical protein
MSQNTVTVHAGEVSTSIKVKRPKFDDLVKPYDYICSIGTVDSNDINIDSRLIGRPQCKIFKEIHKDLYKWCLEGNQNYQNTCATRMSYAFNKGKYKIKLPRKFMDEKTGEPYITSVLDMIEFLKKQFGSSDIRFDGNINNFISKIRGKKGIIVLMIPIWDDATGHVTLWDGRECIDGSNHFGDSPTNILFWELK